MLTPIWNCSHQLLTLLLSNSVEVTRKLRVCCCCYSPVCFTKKERGRNREWRDERSQGSGRRVRYVGVLMFVGARNSKHWDPDKNEWTSAVQQHSSCHQATHSTTSEPSPEIGKHQSSVSHHSECVRDRKEKSQTEGKIEREGRVKKNGKKRQADMRSIEGELAAFFKESKKM